MTCYHEFKTLSMELKLKKFDVSRNMETVLIKENKTDQKIRLVAKVILWAVIGAIACLLPGIFTVGKPGLYWNMTVLGKEVWRKLVPPAMSMLIGASIGSFAAYRSWHENPNTGVLKY